MDRSRKILMFIILGAIIFLFGGYTTTDWLRLTTEELRGAMATTVYPRLSKVVVTFLCAALILVIGKYGLNKKDTRFLKVAFGLIVIADILMYIGQVMAGVGVFALVHAIMIYRNGTGIMEFISNKGISKNKKAFLTYLIVIILFDVLSLTFLMYPPLKGNILFFIIAGYAAFLSISLFVALATIKIQKLPRTNAVLASWGITFFFLCDFTVGLYIILQPGSLKLFVDNLTWMFYTPSLVLIALSGYDFRKNKII
ncbi:MAG: hypothetical protein N3B21_04085 [Clostridia bacterium]|nr:hypothetical protein [Clostridia bacterium]